MDNRGWLLVNPRIECGAESRKVVGSEDDAILRGDIDEIEVDPGSGDLASEVRQDAWSVLDIDDYDFTLARHGNVRNRQ
jgi:hypothetical protein